MHEKRTSGSSFFSVCAEIGIRTETWGRLKDSPSPLPSGNLEKRIY